MKFNPKLPINLRIAERRKKRRLRVYTFLVVVFAVTFVAAGWYKALPVEEIAKGIGSVLAGEENETPPGPEEQELSEPETNDVSTGDAVTEDTNQPSDNPVKPVAEPTPEPQKEKDLNVLRAELENYIKGFKGQYGIYYMNLEDEKEFGINDADVYIAASTVKIPLNLYLYKKIAEGSVDPAGTVTYMKGDYEGGTGSLQYKSVGGKYTVKELSRLSIKVSDNVATNMLLRLLGRKNLKDYMRGLGGTVVEDSRNVSCPKDMGLYMKKVYEFCNSNEALGKELMTSFENTIFKDRIPKLLPENIKIAHKIGNQVGALHDVGIIFAEEPYILSIMSKNVNEAEGYDVIANISKKVYDFVTQ